MDRRLLFLFVALVLLLAPTGARGQVKAEPRVIAHNEGDVTVAQSGIQLRFKFGSVAMGASQMMMATSVLLFVALLLWVSPTVASAQAIHISEPVRVVRGLEERPLIEPHLVVHPANPDHLLGAMMVSVPAASHPEVRAGLTCATVLSLDGGKSWKRHDFSITECYDPWVAITPEGQAVFTALGRHPALPQDDLLVFHSADGGRTWDETPAGLGRGHDHETVAVDARSPDRQGWLYVVSSQAIRADQGRLRYSVFVARSRNGGKTFDAPVRIVPNNLVIKAENPVVLSDGTLVVSLVEAGHARESVIDRLAWIIRSTDGGFTFSMPLFVTEACGPPPTFSLSFLAADTSAGPFQDRLYFACNQRGGGAVVLTSSEDGGQSWTDPIRVHAAPVDTTVLRQVRGLAVNRDGLLALVWSERSGRERDCYEVYFAASLDGARSFLPEQRVSRGRSCPDATANGAQTVRSWPTGGDYYGLAAAPDGRFHLIWPEAREGPFQHWTASIRVNGTNTVRK